MTPPAKTPPSLPDEMALGAQSAKNADVRAEDHPLFEIDGETGKVRAVSAQAQLHAALARAQGAFPSIPRDRTVRVTMKSGGSYTFTYAPLDTIIEKVRPALAAEGLSFSQHLTAQDGKPAIRTALMHEGGGIIEDVFALPGSQALDPQQLGSLLTYVRRYAISALLGVSADRDDDGNHAAGNATQEPAGASRTPRQPQNDPAPTPATAEDLAAYESDVVGANLDWAAALGALGENPTAATLAQHRAQLQTYLANVAAKASV